MTSFRWRLSCFVCLIAVLVLASGCAWAKPVSSDVALDVARAWLSVNPTLAAPQGDETFTVVGIRPFETHAGEVIAYVVELAPRGFIVVPADDLVEPILFYSSESPATWKPGAQELVYDMLVQDIPARIRQQGEALAGPSLMAAYGNMVAGRWVKLKTLAKEGYKPQSFEAAASEFAVIPVVEPMLKTTWDQSGMPNPTYNFYTPKNYVTGCVATAMGMIVHHHRYPDAASGSSTITVDGIPQSASFDSTYNYDIMPTELTQTTPANQTQEVAKLLVDCGTSVAMNYNTIFMGGSGANTADVATALVSTFKYTSASWKDGTDGDWPDVLKSDLDSGYPVQVAIRDPVHGGHSIVCDGWGTEDGANRWHLNMGWGGDSNGWYTMPGFATGSFNWETMRGFVYNIRSPGSGALTCTVKGPASPTNQNPIIFQIKFSGAVTGLTADMIVVTGGTKGELTGSGQNYTLPVTPTADGPVTCQVPAGVVKTADEKPNEISNTATVIYDGTVPTCTATGPDRYSTDDPIEFVFHFSEPVTGFASSKITVTGGAKGSLSGSGQNYSIAVTPVGYADVTCRAQAGAGHDAAGNQSTASELVTTVYDATIPVVRITSPTTSPTYATSIRTVDIAGVASDLNGVKSVSWSNSRGGSGTCAGTVSWSATGIDLLYGPNAITVTATNTLDTTSSDTIYVNYAPSALAQLSVCPGYVGLAIGAKQLFQGFELDSTGEETVLTETPAWSSDSLAGEITDGGAFTGTGTAGSYQAAVSVQVPDMPEADLRSAAVELFVPASHGGYVPERWWGRAPTYRVDFARDVAVGSDGCVYIVDKVNNRVQQFDPAGVFMKSWGSEGSGDGEFSLPSGIALDSSGNIYVADTGNNRIQKFDSKGDFVVSIGTSGTGNGQLSGPEGVAVGVSGSIYVVDTGNFRIQQFDSNGVYANKWGSGGTSDGQFGSPSGIAIDSSGNVYVSDRDVSTPRIQKFNSSGAFIRKWGSYGTSSGQFTSCLDVAMDASNNVYVLDDGYRVQRFNENGVYLGRWGSAGANEGQFNNSLGLGVDSSGFIYVADAGNARVQKFDSAGVCTSKWGYEVAGLGQFERPGQVAVGPDGNIYVADTGNHRIQKFGPSGVFIGAWGSRGIGEGQFDSPAGLTVDSAGQIIVADTGNDRIQVLSAAGVFVRKWGVQGQREGQISSPQCVAVDSSGRVIVTDSYGRAQAFSATGVYQFSMYANGGTSGSDTVWNGVAVDSSGNIYAADTSNDCIHKFNSAGKFSAKFGAHGTGDGKFYMPTGIAIDADDNIYVTDTMNSRIQKFDSAARYVSQWTTAGISSGQQTSLCGIAVDGNGSVFVSDAGNNCVIKFQPHGVALAPVILAPTVQPEYCTQLDVVTLSGVAMSGVSTVTWSTDKGQSGTCTGTLTWHVDDVPVDDGTTIFTITADDGLGATASTQLTVVRDAVAPGITLLTDVPSNVTAPDLALTGTATDNHQVAYVQWYNLSTNVHGLCTGTTNWSASVPLQSGANNITLTSVDPCGNATTISVPVVTFADVTPPTVGTPSMQLLCTAPACYYMTVVVSDDVAVSTVTWSNDRGGSGSCLRTTLPLPAASSLDGIDSDVWGAESISCQPGRNTITVTAYDTTGNFASNQTVAVMPDTTNPTVEITSPTASSTYTVDTDTVTLSGTASDDGGVVGVAWENDRGGTGDCTGTSNWEAADVPLQVGLNVITIAAHDDAGNIGQDTLTITRLGTDPPVVTITLPTDEATYDTHSAILDLAGTATDDVGVASVTWESDTGDSGTCTGTDSWTITGIPLVVGDNVITVTAHDAAGKVGADVITVTFTDTTAPVVVFSTPSADPYPTVAAAIDIAGTVTDDVDVVSVTWSVDRGGEGACTGTTNWSADSIPLDLGQNLITVSAEDSAGNVGVATVAVIRDDGIAPVISVTQPTTAATYSTTDATIDVAGTSSDNVGVVSVAASSNRGGSWLCTGTTAWALTGISLAYGENVLTFTARDATGNTASTTLTVTASDIAPPSVSITGPVSGDTYSTTNVSVAVSGTASDNLQVASVSWSSSRGGSGVCTGTTAWATAAIPLAMGSNVITVTATDSAGLSATDAITVTRKDPTPPTVTITAPTSDPVYATSSGTVSIGGTSTDNEDVTSVTWFNNRGGSGTCSGTSTWTATGVSLSLGANVITVTAGDADGNHSTDTLTVTYTDADAPAVQITSPTQNATYSTTDGTVDLGGTSSDNIGVTSLKWTNDRGGNGACTGVANWTAKGIALQFGQNVITVTARDAAGNTKTDALTVTVTDSTAPTVEITSPTRDASCSRSCPGLKLAGVASDNVGVHTVSWSNDRGGNGVCTGTTSWTIDGITLGLGDNLITITARDAAGNESTDKIAVKFIDFSAVVSATWNGMAMVSLPIIPDSTNPLEVVDFLSGQWAIYQPATNTYVSYGSDTKHLTWFVPQASTPGRGFWAYFGGATGVPCGTLPAQDQPATIKLATGWNLIGQPFATTVTWNTSTIRVRNGSDERTLADAASAGWVKDFAWGWQSDPQNSAPTAGSYYLIADQSAVSGATGVLAPWQAFWLKAMADVDLVIPAP